MLIAAAQNGKKKIAAALVRAGATVNTANITGNTALHYCFEYGYTSLGAFLIEQGADDTRLNEYGLGPYDGIAPTDIF